MSAKPISAFSFLVLAAHFICRAIFLHDFLWRGEEKERLTAVWSALVMFCRKMASADTAVIGTAGT